MNPYKDKMKTISSLISYFLLIIILGVSQVSAVIEPEDEAFLERVEANTFRWFWETTNPENGLVPDRAPNLSFSSVAAVGFGLTAIPVGIERGYITRKQGIDRVLATFDFFLNAPQGSEKAGMTGHRGFYYHFLDMDSGERFQTVELSTIDTALLMMGVLFCQSYFDQNCVHEVAIRDEAEILYRRVEWDWAVVRDSLISMGWHPEKGFLGHDYKAYDEAMFLYLLALGSPSHPIPETAWTDFQQNQQWKEFYGEEHLVFAPLFGHQYAQVWIDFRGIQDDYMKTKGIDYFENSRRATIAQRKYAIDNPGDWLDYGPNIWGLTACDGPIDKTLSVDGKVRQFYSYRARGADGDYVLDDGTIAPTAAGGSIVFAPEIVIPALKEMHARYGEAIFTEHGFVDAFNPSFRDYEGVKLPNGHIVKGLGWFDRDHLGIDQGPILLMIENYRSELIWNVMKRNPHLIRGLKRAGFEGGWLEAIETP